MIQTIVNNISNIINLSIFCWAIEHLRIEGEKMQFHASKYVCASSVKTTKVLRLDRLSWQRQQFQMPNI